MGHSEIDADKWESCVANSLNVCIYAHCWYLDTLSLSWQALVMDDYVAVMPFFSRDGEACLRYGLAWTGVYSRMELTAHVCGMFLSKLEQRFSRINIVFDKYFRLPDAELKGLFFREELYQLETINPPEEVANGDDFLNVLSSRFPKAYNDGLRFREYTPKNIRTLEAGDFVKLKQDTGIRDALRLKHLAEVSVGKRFGYFMEISLADEELRGAVLVTFCDHYIFVPYLSCRKIDKAFGQYLMILDLILRHFAYRPGIIVLDGGRLGIVSDVYKKLGATPFSTYRYKAGPMMRLRRFIRTKIFNKPGNAAL